MPDAIRPFNAVLAEVGKGDLHAELSTALRDLVVAVTDNEKPGSLTLQITVKPRVEGSVLVLHKLTVKAPEPNRPASLFFVDEGNLVRNPPGQDDLPGVVEVSQ